MNITYTTIKIGKVNLPSHKMCYYALTDIPGIGYYQSSQICKTLNIDQSKKLNALSATELDSLNLFLADNYYKINGMEYPLYKYVAYIKKANITQKINMKTEEGFNHALGHRVHGQKRK